MLKAVDTVTRIQRGLAYLVCNVASRKVNKRPSVVVPRPLSPREATQFSQHFLFYQDTRLVCAECRQSVSVNNKKAAILWASTACYKIRGARLQKHDTVHMGKQATHHTHRLAYHRRVLYCVSCGCYATGRHLIKLAKQCESPTQHGRNCLDAFKADKYPPGLSSWPSGERDAQRVAPLESQVQFTEQSITVARQRLDNVYT